jgi:thioredoxin-related protein
MKVHLNFFIIMTVLTVNLTAKDIVVNFTNLSIEEARRKAGVEGKMLFVDFHAKWCTPCKWMEQTTFKDEYIVNSLNADFVAVKIDIDDALGYEVKKSFDVKYLPTILIFNSQGQLIDRIEETLSPRLLKNVLDKHNEPINKQIINHQLNSSPIDNKTTPAESDNMLLSRSEYQKYFQQVQTQSDYRVQVGVFSTYDAADAHVKKLKETFLESITVISEVRNNETLFKVRIGQFGSYDEADDFRLILMNDYKMQGIVQ